MKEQTPKTPRSIVRNHSPYSESIGPIVEEGFVAARVRALQGFSDQTQNVTPPLYPLTPCPLHVFESSDPPRPSFAFRRPLTGTDMPDTCTVKCFNAQIPCKNHPKLVDVSGIPAGSPDVASSVQSQKQQPSHGSTLPRRSSISDKGAQTPTLFKDVELPTGAERSQDRITIPSTMHNLMSRLERMDIDDVLAAKSSPSEKSILSPHAIKADLVEPQATWNCLSQTDDRNNDYVRKQPSKLRGSIADKLGSMVERGWVGGDIFGKGYGDDELASDVTGLNHHFSGTRADNQPNFLREIPRLKQASSYSESVSLSNPKNRSRSQQLGGQSIPPHVKPKEPREFVYRAPPKRAKREADRSHALNSPQRSSSDAGVRKLKTELAMWNGKRRAWTMHHLGRSESSQRHTQTEAFPATWPKYAWDHQSSKQGHGSVELPQSREGSTPKSDFDLVLRDEQLSQDSSALSKKNGSRPSSANTKSSTRSGSRSTSFFKKFPWYKLALVDKQPVAYSFLRRGCSDDRISTATRVAYSDPTSNNIERSHGVSKSHTPIGCGDEEDDNSPRSKTTLHQGPDDQRAIDAMTPYRKAYRQPSLPFMTSPQEMNDRQAHNQISRVLKRAPGSRATSFKIGERLSRCPDQISEEVVRQEHSTLREGRSRIQPRASSHSGSIEASTKVPVAAHILQSFHTQGLEVMEQLGEQSHTFSHAKSTNLHASENLENGSSGCETARPGQGFPARPNLSHRPRSDVVSLSPECLGNGTRSLPANVERSDQHGPMPREPQVGGKGIKKIQVTVTFDGAEDLVIEASLRKRNRHEH